jgi:hypothetical protein
MTYPCSSSSFSWLRKLCSLICLIGGCCSLPEARAQDLDKPLQSIDEEITSFAYAPDGRIAYSVYHHLRTKLYDLEHDDIWLQDSNGKRRRLLQGEKFNRGNQPFSYIVDGLRWSPNGRQILANLLTTTVVDDSGKTQDSFMTLVLEDSGKEIRIAGGDSVIPDASNAFWLPDNATIVYLAEALKPRVLYSIRSTRLATGSLPSFYEGRTFLDVAWIHAMKFAIAIEQDHSRTGPPRLQRLELSSEDGDQELATLDHYQGGLSVSPSGKKVAYFIDKEILEVRDLASPNHVARARVGLGVLQWFPGESRILLKRSLERKSGDLVWMDLPPLAAPSPGHDLAVSEPQAISILHGLSFRDFAISPDGRSLAVVAPGKRNLLVFPLPR